MLLAGCPYFWLGDLVGLIVSLIVGLAIDGAVLMAEKVVEGLLGWSLWNDLISFLRCWTAETGS